MSQLPTKRETGYIQKIVPSQMCGFIVADDDRTNPDGSPKQLFFHANYLRGRDQMRLPVVGTNVRFTRMPKTDKMRNAKAIDVEVVE